MVTGPIPEGYSMKNNVSVHFASTRMASVVAHNLYHFNNDFLSTYFSVLRRSGGLQSGSHNM